MSELLDANRPLEMMEGAVKVPTESPYSEYRRSLLDTRLETLESNVFVEFWMSQD